MSTSHKNLHKMIPCEHLTDVWYRMSQNSYILKWPLQKKIKNQTKTSIFQNYCKAHQYIRVFLVLGHFVIQGRQNRGPKSGCKYRF